ncbi:MAG: TetR/AcrR family transcriptional regulator [Oscillospiraceae bacterium]|jgi:AcrR family transcriptional regulator|nr:TetR/AcrR family transcriptional regulator [Oscillospiraceae bacterium]
MKHETRIDTRTVKTKETIRKTFEAMIIEMEYSDITITELARRAGLHRKTFYLHYGSIDSLVKELEDAIVRRIEASCVKGVGGGSGLDFDAIFKEFSTLIDENKKLHERLFCSDSYYFIFEHIRERSCSFFIVYFRDLFCAPENEIDAIMTFVSNGILSVWRKWYIQGRDPSEEYQKTSLAQLSGIALERLAGYCP